MTSQFRFWHNHKIQNIFKYFWCRLIIDKNTWKVVSQWIVGRWGNRKYT